MCAKQKTHRVCNALIENVFPSRKGIFGQKNGAVDEARTRDLHLGKVALYQLSYYRMYGALGRNRTTDTLIFSQLLYRLSYQGEYGDPEGARTLDLQRDRLAF